MQEQAYQKVMDDYGDAVRMLSEKPELYPFQLELFNRSQLLGREQRSYSRDKMVIRNYVVMLYGFFGRIYCLYRRKWIEEDTWKQQAAFLGVVAAHPVFQRCSPLVSRNVLQTIPRLCLGKLQAQEVKQMSRFRKSPLTFSVRSSL